LNSNQSSFHHHFHPRWDQNPATSITGTEPLWNAGKTTTTATQDANDWYFHVKAFDGSDTPGTSQDLGPFFIDRTPPSASSFRSFNSTAGALAEAQVNDLALGVTVQLAVQDALSGLSLDGLAPLAPVEGTVGLWHFDDPSGSVWKDSGTAGIQLSGSGVVTRAAGRFRTGLLLDGSGNLSAAPSSLPLGASARSVEVWINPVSTQTTLGLVTWGAAGANTLMRLGMINGRMSTDMGGVSNIAGPVLSTGVWQHAVFTYDGSAARYYLNGVFVGSHTYGAVATSAGALYVGAGEGATLRFRGSIDELRILNRALTLDEVSNDYSRGDPYYAAYSTSAGNSWQFVLSTTPGSGPWVARSGAHGSSASETISLYGLNLIVSTSTAVGAQATNQVFFYAADRAGNAQVSGPFGVLVDTNAAVALSTPIAPVNGVYAGPRPNFDWAGPSTSSVAAMAGPGGNGGRFYLQAASNDPSFSPGSIVLSISTPA
ncbi:MAG: LamG domain-containing protein, partial [Elusimicrobiota bacterium]